MAKRLWMDGSAPTDRPCGISSIFQLLTTGSASSAVLTLLFDHRPLALMDRFRANIAAVSRLALVIRIYLNGSALLRLLWLGQLMDGCRY